VLHASINLRRFSNASSIRLLSFVTNDVRQRGLDQIAWIRCFIASPVTEARAEAMHSRLLNFHSRSTIFIAIFESGLPRTQDRASFE
jgi:hypothetical protein